MGINAPLPEDIPNMAFVLCLECGRRIDQTWDEDMAYCRLHRHLVPAHNSTFTGEQLDAVIAELNDNESPRAEARASVNPPSLDDGVGVEASAPESGMRRAA